MGKIVQVNRDFQDVFFPNGVTCSAGQQTTLTDAQFTSLPLSVTRLITVISTVPDPVTPAAYPSDITKAASQVYVDSKLTALSGTYAPVIGSPNYAASAGFENRARLSFAPTPTWFQTAKVGLFTHYTWGSSTYHQTTFSDGTVPTDVNALANAFDATHYANTAAALGAEYVVFTAWHYNMNVLYPSTVMNATLTGHASTRDLIADLIAALKAKGIKLVLYIHVLDGADLSAGDQATTGWNDATSNYATWNAFINNLVTELGTRYGTDIAGFWVDMTTDPNYATKLGAGTNAATLRASLLAGNASRVILGNAGGSDSQSLGVTQTATIDLYAQEYNPAPAAINNWVASYNHKAALATTTGVWWASVATGTNVLKYPASDMFRFLVLQAGSTINGGGMLWNAGCYAGSGTSIWEDGIETMWTALGALISPIAASLKATIPSSSYVTANTATITTLGTPGYVATTSKDGYTEYVHVLNAPAGALSLPAPADGATFGTAVNLATGHPVIVELPAAGGYKLTLTSGDTWSATDTVIALTRTSKLGDQQWIDAPRFTTSNTATLQPTGGGSRFPTWSLNTNQQIECSFSVPPSWKSFAADLYWTQSAAGTGSPVLSVTTSTVSPGALLTSGDVATFGASAPLPGTVNQLATLTIVARILNTPFAIHHVRIARGSDAVPNAAVLGIMLRRLT